MDEFSRSPSKNSTSSITQRLNEGYKPGVSVGQFLLAVEISQLPQLGQKQVRKYPNKRKWKKVVDSRYPSRDPETKYGLADPEKAP